MSDYQHALHETPSDFKAHAATYHRFLVLVRYVALAHIAAGAAYLFAVLADAGWLTGAVVAAAVLAAGFAVNRRLERAGEGPEAERLRLSPRADTRGGPHGQTPPHENAVATSQARAYDPVGRLVLIVLWAVVVTAWAVISVPSFLGILGAVG